MGYRSYGGLPTWVAAGPRLKRTRRIWDPVKHTGGSVLLATAAITETPNRSKLAELFQIPNPESLKTLTLYKGPHKPTPPPPPPVQ